MKYYGVFVLNATIARQTSCCGRWSYHAFDRTTLTKIDEYYCNLDIFAINYQQPTSDTDCRAALCPRGEYEFTNLVVEGKHLNIGEARAGQLDVQPIFYYAIWCY